MFSSVESTVGHVRIKIDNGTITVEKEKLKPSGRTVKTTKKRKKILHTIGRSDQPRREKQISLFTRQRINRTKMNARTNTKARGLKRTLAYNQRRNKRTIKRRKSPDQTHKAQKTHNGMESQEQKKTRIA